jgi:DNA mismatch repair protein MutS
MHSGKIFEKYLKIHNKYKEKFGEQTLVLMQVGYFYECYSVPGSGPDLTKLEELTDLAIVPKDSKKIICPNNPYMCGFPTVSINKYIEKLVNNGYHVVVVDQEGTGQDVERNVSGVYSPGTYIDNINNENTNRIIGLIIEELSQKDNDFLVCCGMTSIDCTTGEVFVHESYSNKMDHTLGMDEASRFINSLSPREVIVYKGDFKKLTEKNIIEYLNLGSFIHNIKNIDKQKCTVSYQKKIFENIYSSHASNVDILDTLGIRNKTYVRNSFSSILSYISDHLTDWIKGLKIPKFYLGGKNMVLGNDAINQLSVVNYPQDNKSTCLLKIINQASTNMGKRYIDLSLISPSTDVVELEKKYNIIEKFQKNNFFKNVEILLKKINDIERMNRNIGLQKLHPYNMVEMISSFRNIEEIFEIVSKNLELAQEIPVGGLKKKVSKFNNKIIGLFDINLAKMYKINEISRNIFNKGTFTELDDLDVMINSGHNMMDMLLDKLKEMLNDKYESTGKNIKDKERLIHLKNTKTDGYYYELTKMRYSVLEKIFNENKQVDIGGTIIKFSEINIKVTKNSVKLMTPFLKNHTNKIEELTKKMIDRSLFYYKLILKEVNDEFGPIISESIKHVTMIDYYSTIAKVSNMYGYSRPIIRDIDDNIDNNQPGYLNITELRHPIVERIIDHEYIPHSLELGENLKGMLIYGLNASGKSVLMKAIGLAVIMAQAGFFVAAKEFTYFPYKSLYTRITGHDDMQRGLSSFSLEMVELNAILSRADESMLVIGDEVCSGTESVSGTAIVASTLVELSNIGSSFVFATHLHDLVDQESIQDLENVKPFHLSVETDPKTNELIYDRILKPGNGDRIYGITVAKNILENKKIIERALEIKNKMLDGKTSKIIMKKSRYNKSVIMDKCELCSRQNCVENSILETHHINHQKDCKDGLVIGKQHITKNSPFNLMVVCSNCHDKIHNGKIDIKGYRMTTKGKKLIKTSIVCNNNM